MSRLLFTKEGVSIWSSHLDLMRALMRSFRRAGIDLKHSQGFTPHPELSILMPLSVGVESQCEIAEFTLAEGCVLPPEEIVARLNPVLPGGIRALDCWEDGKKAGKLAWLRVRLTLDYRASEDGGCVPPCRDGSQPSARPEEAADSRRQAAGDEGTDSSAPLRCAQNDRIEALRALFARPSLVVEKHSKKGPVETDIAPMIRELTVEATDSRQQASGDGRTDSSTPLRRPQNDKSGGDAVVIEAVVAAQNPTLNPLLLVTAIESYLPEHKPEHVLCRRLEVYDQDMNVFR